MAEVLEREADDVGVRIRSTDVDFEPAPINPNWIIEGTPRARWKLLFNTKDGLEQTVMWDCTAGKFHWNYANDETILVLEGGMSITAGDVTRHARAGDVVLIPAGSRTVWLVQSHVRKLAWVRQPMPNPTGLGLRLYNRIRYRNYRSRF